MGMRWMAVSVWTMPRIRSAAIMTTSIFFPRTTENNWPEIESFGTEEGEVEAALVETTAFNGFSCPVSLRREGTWVFSGLGHSLWISP